MVQKANAYYLQLQDRYINRYRSIVDIPQDLRDDYRMLSRSNLDWFAKAEALGWAPQTDGNTASYLNFIKHERNQKEN